MQMADRSDQDTSGLSREQQERKAKIEELARCARESIATGKLASADPQSSSASQSARGQKRQADPDCRVILDQIADNKRTAVADTSKAVGGSLVPHYFRGEGVRGSSAVGEVGAAAAPGTSSATPTDAARDVHIRARSRPAAKEESLLVRHSNIVPAVAQIRSVFGGGSSLGGRSVFSVISNQSAKKPTSCKFGLKKDTSTLDGMPSGQPVVDHLAAALHSHGWDQLKYCVTGIQEQRLSGLREDEWPDVRELTLGKSTDLQFREAIEWLNQKHRQTKQEYHLLLPAVDTESISLVKSSPVFSFRDVLEEASNRQYARGVRFSVSESNSSGIPVPVLLMYGSMGWQLHLRIHVLREEARNQTSKYAFGKSALPEVVTKLMGMLEPGIGQGVRADVDEFLQMMEAH